MIQVVHCRSCRARIVWLTTSNDKRIPVDADSIEGALCSSEASVNGVHAFSKDWEKDPITPPINCAHCGIEPPELPLFIPNTHISHFATCKDAKRWRKPTPKGTTRGD